MNHQSKNDLKNNAKKFLDELQKSSKPLNAKERLNIPSTIRVYKFLEMVIKEKI